MKANLILVVILLLIATIYFATETQNKQSTETTEAMNPLLKGFDENLVTRIQITKGGKVTNIYRKNLILERKLQLPADFPGEWLIQNARFHPAKTNSVSQLLSDLTNMKKGFKTSEDANFTSTDVSQLKKYGVDEDEALKIELFKQVSEYVEKNVKITEEPYFSLLVGKSSETEEFRGMYERFIRVGTFDETTITGDENQILDFKYDNVIRRVKQVNVDIMSANVDNWINLDVFKLKEVLSNVDDFECINIINKDDSTNSIYLAKTESETFDDSGNEITENNWNFYDDPISALKLDSYKPTEKADNNSVKDFLYGLKAFRAKGYKGLQEFIMTLNGDLNPRNNINARLIIEGELHKKISDVMRTDLKDREVRITRLKSQLYSTPDSNQQERQNLIIQISREFIDKLVQEESRIYKFYVYEGNKDIRTADELKKTIEESGKSVDDISATLNLSTTLIQQMMDGKTPITEEVIDRIRSEYPFMFHNYWMILTTSRFLTPDYVFVHWQYSLSYDQIKRLAPEKKEFQIEKPEENPEESNPDDVETPDDDDQQTKPDSESKAEIIEDTELPMVKIKTNYGDIIIELYEDDAPNAVASFISLCEAGFYDGIRFHRIEKNNAIYVGSPYARGKITSRADSGDAGYRFSDEIKENTKRTDEPGMLLTENIVGGQFIPDANGSRFFITLKEFPDIYRYHTVFGKIVTGLDVAKRIGDAETIKRVDLGKLNAPMDDIYIVGTEVLKKRAHEYKVTKIEDEK